MRGQTTDRPTREELMAAVADAQSMIDEANRLSSGYMSTHGRVGIALLVNAQAALDRHDARDWEMVRGLLDAHDVVWEWRPGAWYEDPEAERTGTHMPRRTLGTHHVHLYGRPCDDDPCGTGPTRIAALLDLARKVAASNANQPAEAGEERAT